jgi:ribose 5-phosphate isomerase B
MKRTIVIACDHAGYTTKIEIISYLEYKGYQVMDVGAWSDESVDYPDFAHPLAEAVEEGEAEFGISLCGSGNGINMAANKHQGIRSALCWSKEIARLARLHNDANVCAIPARFVSVVEAIEIVETFLKTQFEGGRHIKRIEKIPL